MAADGAFPAMSIADAHKAMCQPGTMFEIEVQKIHGNPIRVWKNAPANLRDLYAATALHAGRDAFVYENERVTYGGYRAAAIKFAHQLIKDGVKKGDRIAIAMRNLPEWPITFWGAVLAGAIVTPLNAWWTGPELEYGLSDSGSKILVVDAERFERLREHLEALPALEKIYVPRATEEIADPRVVSLESAIGAPNDWSMLKEEPLPDVPLAPDDDVTIFYTSGTTGKPKGAISSHRNIISNIINAASGQTRAFLRRGEAPPVPDPAAPQKATLISVPFFHATGTMAIMIPMAMSGSKIVMQRRWDVDAALPLIEKERINSVGGVPTIAWQILEHPRFNDYDLSSLETVSYGGAPSAPELVKRIQERFPKVQPGQGWGMTETSATAVSNFGEDYKRKPASCGVPAPTGEAKIMEVDSTKELPVGEVGELWYRGPTVVRGYWNKPEATKDTFVEGWVKTGDLARFDEEGFLYIVDRAKDMLIRGGENIYCVEVENAIYTHPAVMDAAVIGIPHKTLGEEPAAVVHLKPGMDVSEQELRSHVASLIAAFKVPVKIAFLPDNLPRNANGKIMKRDLKAVFENA